MAETIRPFVHQNIKKYHLSDYLRIVYNDAMTYDAATKTGGLRANFKYSQVARAPQNKHLQLLIQEL